MAKEPHGKRPFGGDGDIVITHDGGSRPADALRLHRRQRLYARQFPSRLPRRAWQDVTFWLRKAFDRHYFELLATQSGSTGLVVGQPGDPRTWGVTVRTQF
jgi:hypothetical protein